MSSHRVRLTSQDRCTIEGLVRDPSTTNRVLLRVHIIWLSALGKSVRAIAAEAYVSEHTVRLWIGRFNARGVAGLRDMARPGAPRIHDERARAEIRWLAVCSPAALGLPFTRWTLDRLHGYLRHQRGITIGRSRLHEILREGAVDWRGSDCALCPSKFVSASTPQQTRDHVAHLSETERLLQVAIPH